MAKNIKELFHSAAGKYNQVRAKQTERKPGNNAAKEQEYRNKSFNHYMKGGK